MVFLFISTVLYFQVHRYDVPVHQYCVVLPGTSLWCSCSSVLCCTSRYITMMFLFSTVLYFQVHRYGVPLEEKGVLHCTKRQNHRRLCGGFLRGCVDAYYHVFESRPFPKWSYVRCDEQRDILLHLYGNGNERCCPVHPSGFPQHPLADRYQERNTGKVQC